MSRGLLGRFGCRVGGLLGVQVFKVIEYLCLGLGVYFRSARVSSVFEVSRFVPGLLEGRRSIL